MNPRRLSLTLLFLPFVVSLLSGQVRRIATDKSPAFLFGDPSTGYVHIVTAGVDANFNGLFEPDSGDMPARWFAVNAATEQIVDSTTFNTMFASFPPLRPGVDLKRKRLYVAQMGRIREFDIATLDLVRDTVLLGEYSAVSVDTANNRLMLAQRPSFTDPGVNMIIDAATGDTVARVRAGMNTSSTITRRGSLLGGVTEYYTLNEGSFGAPDASVSYLMMQPDIYQAMNSGEVAGGVQEAVRLGDRLYVIVGGGHAVHVIDLKTHKDLPFSPITLGAFGPSGPRTSAFQGDSMLLVGSQAGELYRIRTADGTIADSLKLRSSIEAISIRGPRAYVALRTKIAAPASDSTIAIVDLASWSVVDSIKLWNDPVATFFSGEGDLHVIGGHPDHTNFWWGVVDPATHAVKSLRHIDGKLANLFRYAYHAPSDTLFLVASGELRAYPVAAGGTESSVLLNSQNLRGALAGVSEVGGYLVAFETSNVLHLLTRKGDYLGKLRVSDRPTMAVHVDGTRENALAFYVISRGAMAAKRSFLDYVELAPNIFGADTIGRLANHLLAAEDAGIITLNGSHALTAFAFDDWDLMERIPTGTSGFDGPREAIQLDDERLAVSTYAGDVRVLTEDEAPLVFPAGGKAEGMTLMNGKLFVAVPFTPAYAPDTNVVVFDASSLVASVERRETIASATMLEQNHPNPATNGTSIRFAITTPGHVALELYAMNGEKIETLIDSEMESGDYNVTVRIGALPSGSYLYTLRHGSTLLTRIMQVTR